MTEQNETIDQASEVEQGQTGANGSTPPKPINPFRLDMLAQAAEITQEEFSIMVVNRAAGILTAAIDAQEGAGHISINMADEKGPIQMIVARVPAPDQEPEFEPAEE